MHTLIMMQDDRTWISKGTTTYHDMSYGYYDEEFESPPLSPLMDICNDEESTNEDIPSTDFNKEQTAIYMLL